MVHTNISLKAKITHSFGNAKRHNLKKTSSTTLQATFFGPTPRSRDTTYDYYFTIVRVRLEPPGLFTSTPTSATQSHAYTRLPQEKGPRPRQHDRIMLPERATRRTPQKLPSVQTLLQRLLSILLCLAIWSTALRLYHRLSNMNPDWTVPSWTAFFAIVGAVSFVAGCVSVFVVGQEQEQADDSKQGKNGSRDEKCGQSGLYS